MKPQVVRSSHAERERVILTVVSAYDNLIAIARSKPATKCFAFVGAFTALAAGACRFSQKLVCGFAHFVGAATSRLLLKLKKEPLQRIQTARDIALSHSDRFERPTSLLIAREIG